MDFIRDILAIPFGFALSLFYNLTDSYILAIILLTVIIRCALLPASISQQKNSAKQVRLQTKVNKIKQKYAGNQQKIQEETQALYQREGFGAANMGCAPLMIQMIVMIGLYEVDNNWGLNQGEDNHFVITERSGEPRASADRELIRQALEMSTVDLAAEMVHLIETQRSYQLSSRVVTTSDELMSIANNLRR